MMGRMWRWVKWGIVGVVAVVALFYGAVFVYTNFINKPEPTLSFEQRDAEVTRTTVPAVSDTTPTETAVTSSTDAPIDASSPSPDGVWVATDESELGYRVKEVLGGVDTEGVGRTNQITGSLTIDGTSLTEASFEVDMASITSDSDRRDNQFRTRIMDVETFPTATFVLTEPLGFGAVPDGDEPLTATASGDLTLRGTTNQVTFEVEARQVRGTIEVLGQIPVVFADYGIPNPSIGPVSTEDNGLLEFLLVFTRP
jgi:polyisoprenoid-binding protein YceI